MAYTPRFVDGELRRRLEAAGAVVIEGPKACGKTETAKRQARSVVLLDIDAQALAAARVDPTLVLDGAVPRLLDEWQTEPAIWNHVRRAVDERQAPGQFILTGSSVPSDDVDRHTGAGRFSFLRMRPMSLAEAGHTNGQISFEGLFDGAIGAGRRSRADRGSPSRVDHGRRLAGAAECTDPCGLAGCNRLPPPDLHCRRRAGCGSAP